MENSATVPPKIGDFPSETEESLQTKELYLRFYLPSEAEFALPAAGIREVIQQPVEKLTSVPNASPLLLGAINLRGRVIWVADLGKFLGYDGELSGERKEIPTIVIENQDTILALAVGRLGNMEWLDAGQLGRGTNLPDTIAPYVKRQWAIEGASQPVLRILDHSAILDSARWAA